MISIADDATAIRERMRQIRLEEWRPDDDWRTANDRDLEAIAARHALTRAYQETDWALRQRIAAVIGA